MKLGQVNLVTNKYNNTNKNQNSPKMNFNGFPLKLADANKNLMHYIETGGFFAEFVIMDLCGLVLPRVWQGFNRNKEELGHWNVQAGTEELLREGITGPSMFLIPIGAVILAGKMLGKGTQINSTLLQEFSKSFKNIGTELANSDLVKKQKAFAGKIFDDMFINNHNKKALPQNHTLKSLQEYKDEFVTQLTNSLDTKIDKKTQKENIGKFNDLIANINASYFDNNNATAIIVSRDGKTTSVATSATDLYKDARKYMEDVVASTDATFKEKTSSGNSITQDIINNTIDGITKIRENGRKLLCVGGTASLAAFLSIIPKIYQISKTNPALNGIAENNEGGNK